MVLHVDGTTLDEAPPCAAVLYHQFPQLRESGRRLVASLPSSRRGATYNATGDQNTKMLSMVHMTLYDSLCVNFLSR